MKRLLTWFSSINIGRKLTMLIIVLVVLPILIINTIFYKGTETFTHENILQSEQQLLRFALNGTEKLVEQMILVTNAVCFNKQLSGTLMKKEHGERLSYAELTEVYNILANAYPLLIDYTSFINIFDAYGECISLLSDANEFIPDMTLQLDKLEKAVDADGRYVWFAPYDVLNTVTQSTDTYLTIARLVDGTGRQADNASIVMMFIDTAQIIDKLLAPYAKTDENEDIFIADENGRIILHSDELQMGTSMDARVFEDMMESGEQYLLDRTQGNTTMINFQKIAHTDWFLVRTTDYSAQVSALRNIRLDSILFTMLVLSVFILITANICRSTMKPLKRLQKQISDVQEGHFHTVASYDGKNEITLLGQNLNQMIRYIDDLIERMRIEQESKEQLRFELMQAQINPHFIFNTLNMIKWTALIHNNQDIAALVQDFGRIVGMSINDLNKLISIKSELANLDSYMNIQRMRFNYPLTLETHCSPDDLSLMVPRLVLQPIVENAIVHGFDASYERELHIELRIARSGDTLHIGIHDDGNGIEPGKLREINEDLQKQSHKNRFNRIGLQNVHKRIQMMFSEAYGISIQSESGKGTMVELVLPLMEGDGQEEDND